MSLYMRSVLQRHPMALSYLSVWCLLFGSLALILGVRPYGAESAFMPLLYLPLFLAILTWRFTHMILLGTGLCALTLWMDFLLRMQAPSGLPHLDTGVHSGLILFVSALGGLVMLQAQRQQQSVAQRLEETDNLLRVSLWIDSCRTLEEAADVSLRELSRIQPYAVAALYLLDEDQRTLTAESVFPEAAVARLHRHTLPAEEWNLDDRLSQPVYAPDAAHPTWRPLTQLGEGVRSYLIIPLKVAGDPALGLLYVGFDEPDPLDEKQRRRVADYTRCVAISLQRVQLQERFEDMAYTDPLTQLPNHRAFQQHLSEEVRRAGRYGHALSLIALDLDRFKRVNDTYGHPTGDRLLCQIGAILRASVRETDFPARYGGEEFMILCPETGVEEAGVVAERIRRAVQDSPFAATDSERLQVSVSLGVACFPTDGGNEAALFDQADAALYRAKRGGRNRVAYASPVRASKTSGRHG